MTIFNQQHINIYQSGFINTWSIIIPLRFRFLFRILTMMASYTQWQSVSCVYSLLEWFLSV